jgi:hypothetical protein
MISFDTNILVYATASVSSRPIQGMSLADPKRMWHGLLERPQFVIAVAFLFKCASNGIDLRREPETSRVVDGPSVPHDIAEAYSTMGLMRFVDRLQRRARLRR